jgi:O-antigen/teichoic acid export membrane protein
MVSGRADPVVDEGGQRVDAVVVQGVQGADLIVDQEADGPGQQARRETASQIRGSALFLFGRALAMGLNFIVQVVIVRYLTKAEYGAFAYALAIVNTGEMIVTLGLDQALTRFLSIYDEERDYPRMLGTILLALATILSLGLALVLIVIGLQGTLVGQVVNDSQATALLVILIALSPIQALDDVIMGLFAVFAAPRAIFVRKFLLDPGLKLAVVGLLVLSASDVTLLAWGYLLAGAAAVLLYGYMSVDLLRRHGALPHLDIHRLEVPAREVFSFTLPLLTTNLVFIDLNTSDELILEHFQGPEAVAAWRVVQPLAGLNQLGVSSFALLYTPVAARLFARHDGPGLDHLYWQTAVWLALITFPLFAATFALADPLMTWFYGPRYAASAPFLALLSLGYYVSAALGFNGLTLRVVGVIRYIVVVNLAAVAVNLVLNIVLILRFGPLGAAIGTAVTLILRNVLNQIGLRSSTSVQLLSRAHLPVYGSILIAALLLLVLQVAFHPGPIVGIAAVLIASAAVLGSNRRALEVASTFPELLRLPFARRIFGA